MRGSSRPRVKSCQRFEQRISAAMTPSKAALFLAAALALAAAAKAQQQSRCELRPAEMCALNGPGVFCHPCYTSSYFVCNDGAPSRLERCPGGQWRFRDGAGGGRPIWALHECMR